MNIRKISGKQALLTATALFAFAAAPAGANEPDPKLTVTFITDAAQGTAIGRQEYELAARRLENSRGRGINDFYIANNLCVSYLKIGELEKAQEKCDAAVARIEKLLRSTSRNSSYARDYEKLLAIALSNRGVVYVVSDKPAEARVDFNAAIESSADLRQPKMNLARLTEIQPGTV